MAASRDYVILVQAVFAASFLLAFALLISGINKRKKWLLLPYIVLGTIAMAINVLGVIYFVFSNNEDPRGALVVVGVSVITIPLGIHNVLSIISLFMNYKSKPTDVSKDDSSQHLQDSSNNHDANHEAGDPSNVETMEPNDNQNLSSIFETNELADTGDSQNSLFCETTL
ncbi:uncharacterized protein LOC119646925 isoform X2 [Hermetia illucens]|uniref:uncharacterized protein LOC119646925 isoform X2 n=1 Tax=Hermetia illucens TaxID=343691 RepID=UPI0018CC6019|nr:uncharacterized protein LOC119646925 isoform X2 [Hermetia illucens]